MIRNYIAKVECKDGIYEARFHDFPSCPVAYTPYMGLLDRVARDTLAKHVATLKEIPESTILTNLEGIKDGATLIVVPAQIPSPRV